MKIKLKITFLLLGLLGIFSFGEGAEAANHYIRQGANGANNGNDWTNAWTTLPAVMTRGDTYVIAGGTYGGKTFNDSESGSSVITIRKASSLPTYRDDQIAGWSSSLETTQTVFIGQVKFSKGHYVIDGLTPSGFWKTSGYGIKFSYTNPNTHNHLVEASTSSASYITIKHCEFEGSSNGNFDQWGIYAISENNQTPTFSGWYIGYNYFHGCTVNIKNAAFSPVGWIYEYNYFDRNYTGDSHGDQVSFVGIGGSTPHTIRYNWFEPYRGTGSIVYLWYENRTASDLKIYGNVWNGMPSSGSAGNGWICTGDSSESSLVYNNWKIYNNTVYCKGGVAYLGIGYNSAHPSGWELKNNLFYNCSNLAYSFDRLPEATFSYNYYNASTWNWNACSNCVHSSESLATLFPNYASNDFHLGRNSQAIDSGVVLASPYNIDVDGNSSSGNGRDMGAYEYVSGISIKPGAPKGLSVR